MMCGQIQAADSTVLVSHPDLIQLREGEGSCVTSPNSKSLGLWKHISLVIVSIGLQNCWTIEILVLGPINTAL